MTRPGRKGDGTSAGGSFERILLIQLGDIGDVILTLPAVRALRDRFPESEIALCVREKARDIMADCPWASAVISVRKEKKGLKAAIGDQIRWIRELRRHRFDLAIDFRTGTRGAVIAALSGAGTRIGRFAEDGRLWRNRVFTHLVVPPDERMQYAAEHNLNILAPLKLKIGDRRLHMPVPARRCQAARRLLADACIPPNRPLVVFHPFSLWHYKEWRVDACAELIDEIQTHYDVTVLITGSSDERGRADQVLAECRTRPFNLAGKTAIGEMAALLSMSKAFIGVDTAALHLAAAVGTPTLGIFGPSPAVCWAPQGSRHQVVTKGLPCIPCRRKGCENSEISRCLDELTVKDVHEALFRFLDAHITGGRMAHRP